MAIKSGDISYENDIWGNVTSWKAKDGVLDEIKKEIDFAKKLMNEEPQSTQTENQTSSEEQTPFEGQTQAPTQ